MGVRGVQGFFVMHNGGSATAGMTLTRLEDLRKVREVVRQLFEARGLDVEADSAAALEWTATRLGRAFQEGDPLATQLAAKGLLVVFATPRPWPTDRFQRESCTPAFEAATAETKDLLIVANEAASSHVLRAIAAWKTEEAEAGRVRHVQTMREAALRFNPLRRHDGPLHIRALGTDDDALERHRVKAEELPRYTPDDPLIAFLGLREGTVVECTRKSETAGVVTEFRLIEHTGDPTAPTDEMVL